MKPLYQFQNAVTDLILIPNLVLMYLSDVSDVLMYLDRSANPLGAQHFSFFTI